MIINKTAIRNIKTSKPNEVLVKQLTKLLDFAKTGELTSMISVCAWDDDTVSHGWAYTTSNSRRRLLAELVLLQHDFVTDTGFAENDSVLARRFEDWA